MSEQKPPFTISQNYEILELEKGKAYPIPVSDWDYLKKKVERIGPTSLTFHTIASVLLGVAGTALVSALTLPNVMTQTGYFAVWVSWLVFGVTSISGLLSWYFSRRERKVLACSKGDFLEEMVRLERRCGK